MLDLAQILSCPTDLKPIILFLKAILQIVQIGIPIILILMGTIDLGKAVLSSDDKEIKGATGRLIKRAIAAVAVFFVATIVSLLMGLFTSSGSEIEGTDSWKDCWNLD